MVNVLVVRAKDSDYLDALYFDGQLVEQGYGLTSVGGVLDQLEGETVESSEVREIEITAEEEEHPFPAKANDLPE